MAAVVNYSPPWWVNLLHRLPHFNLGFEQTSSDFRPEDSSYQFVSYSLHYSKDLIALYRVTNAHADHSYKMLEINTNCMYLCFIHQLYNVLVEKHVLCLKWQRYIMCIF